jgi:uncharacterized protein
MPEILELASYRNRSSTVSGQLSTAAMARLRDVGAAADEAVVSLTLTAENRGDIELSGHVESSIGLTCQRCLDPVEVPLVSEFEFVIMDAADAQSGDEESADVIVVDDGMLRLRELVEDELLLSLPVVARHDVDWPCRPLSQQFGPADESAPARDNPFAVLADLKRDRED